MKEYILAILGVILIGSLIDIILPHSKISAFIKSMFSLFVLAVIVSPLTKFLSWGQDYFNITRITEPTSAILYDDMVVSKENYIESMLNSNGYKNIDIKLQYDIKNDEIEINCCKVFTGDLVIDLDKQHINKYDYIRRIIKNCVMLNDEEIVFDG